MWDGRNDFALLYYTKHKHLHKFTLNNQLTFTLFLVPALSFVLWHELYLARLSSSVSRAHGPPSARSGHEFSGHRRVTTASGYARSPPFSCHGVGAATEVKIKDGGRRLAPPSPRPKREGEGGRWQTSQGPGHPTRKTGDRETRSHISSRVEWDTLPAFFIRHISEISPLFGVNALWRRSGWRLLEGLTLLLSVSVFDNTMH